MKNSTQSDFVVQACGHIADTNEMTIREMDRVKLQKEVCAKCRQDAREAMPMFFKHQAV